MKEWRHVNLFEFPSLSSSEIIVRVDSRMYRVSGGWWAHIMFLYYLANIALSLKIEFNYKYMWLRVKVDFDVGLTTYWHTDRTF